MPDMALSVTLRHVMPIDRIRELAYSGRIVTGQEAFQLGLVTAVKARPVESALELASDLAARSPDAIRAIKRLTTEAWSQSTDVSLRTEAQLQIGLMGSHNQLEAVQANLANRDPAFRDADS
jgi:enoyl-CoA hydratase/carnithine racemase